MLREHVLVGGNHLFSGFQGLHDIGSRRFHAAHELDHKLDLLIFQDLLPVVRHDLLRDPRAVLLCVPYQDLLNFQAGTGLLEHLIL